MCFEVMLVTCSCFGCLGRYWYMQVYAVGYKVLCEVSAGLSQCRLCLTVGNGLGVHVLCWYGSSGFANGKALSFYRFEPMQV